MNICVVIPTFNEEGNVEQLYKEVGAVLKGHDFTLLFVDDGSTDKSLEIIQRLAAKDKRVTYLSFSRNFGHQAALRAGLANAGDYDCVVSMDADLQHPPELLPEMIKKWREGYEVVYTLRDDRAARIGLAKKVTSRQFYKLMNGLSDIKVPAGAADFRLLDKKVVAVINHVPEPNLFLRGYIQWVGFNQYAIPYVPNDRFSGTSGYSVKKMLSIASHGITQFSVKPLRFSLLVGFCFALGAFAYGLIAVVSYFMYDKVVSGWTSVLVSVLFTSGVQLMLLGVLGEYLGKTFIQTKARPDYIVKETNIHAKPKQK
jgi:polyisoprenyl-phosphate glycosyltransferase